MKLSPLYEALIFIEDHKQASLSDFDFLSKAVLRGILGKMEAMKLIEKRTDSYFSISKKGQALLNKFLDNLHRGTLHWDGMWRMVCFSVPESNRPVRDKFRRELEGMGLRMLLTGLWITPLDLGNLIEQKAKDMKILNNVFIIKSSDIKTGITEKEFMNLWEFEQSKQEIYQYIEDAEAFLKNKNKTSFEIKKMIFRYALILENQPKVPIELFPKDWPQFRANLVYKKVRRSLVG